MRERNFIFHLLVCFSKCPNISVTGGEFDFKMTVLIAVLTVLIALALTEGKPVSRTLGAAGLPPEGIFMVNKLSQVRKCIDFSIQIFCMFIHNQSESVFEK